MFVPAPLLLATTTGLATLATATMTAPPCNLPQPEHNKRDPSSTLSSSSSSTRYGPSDQRSICDDMEEALLGSVPELPPLAREGLNSALETYTATADPANPTIYCAATTAFPPALRHELNLWTESMLAWCVSKADARSALASMCPGPQLDTKLHQEAGRGTQQTAAIPGRWSLNDCEAVSSYLQADCTGRVPAPLLAGAAANAAPTVHTVLPNKGAVAARATTNPGLVDPGPASLTLSTIVGSTTMTTLPRSTSMPVLFSSSSTSENVKGPGISIITVSTDFEDPGPASLTLSTADSNSDSDGPAATTTTQTVTGGDVAPTEVYAQETKTISFDPECAYDLQKCGNEIDLEATPIFRTVSGVTATRPEPAVAGGATIAAGLAAAMM